MRKCCILYSQRIASYRLFWFVPSQSNRFEASAVEKLNLDKSGPETTSQLVASSGIHLTVTPYTKLNPGGVLPYAIWGGQS